MLMTAATLAMGGCASFSPDGGMSVVETGAAEMLGKDAVKIRTEEDAAHAQERVKALLAKPLTADSSV
jgi:hypothetical protein